MCSCAENRHHRSGAPRDNAPFWYSYDYGSVHFTVISTEHSLEHGSPQYEVRRMRVAPPCTPCGCAASSSWHPPYSRCSALGVPEPGTVAGLQLRLAVLGMSPSDAAP